MTFLLSLEVPWNSPYPQWTLSHLCTSQYFHGISPHPQGPMALSHIPLVPVVSFCPPGIFVITPVINLS